MIASFDVAKTIQQWPTAEEQRAPSGPLPPLPEEIPTERWIMAGIFIVTCAYLLSFCRYTSMDPDEGIVLQGAERILHGQVLYRDFFSFYTPGSYYLLALILKLFGDSFIVARIPLVFYGGVFAVFAYAMARRTCARWCALFTAYLSIVACLPWRFMVLHNWDSTLWMCLAVYCALAFMRSSRVGWAFALGNFLCLTFLFEQSKGVGLAIGLAAGFLLLARSSQSAPWFSPRNAIALIAGLALPLAITLGYFVEHHAFKALLADWAWPLQHYSAVNQVPYGYSDWSDQARATLFGSGSQLERFVALLAVSPCFLLPALPIFSLLLLLYWTARMRRGFLAPDRATYYVILCSSMAGALLSVMVVRANIIHFVYITPLFYLVLSWMIDGRDIGGRLLRALQPAIVAIVFVTFTSAGMALFIANRSARAAIVTRKGIVRTSAPDEFLQYVLRHVSSEQKIFVYPYFPLGYYLTGTSNSTRYEYLQPGMHTPEQQNEAIREIEANQTEVVLFETSFYEKITTSWPNTPAAALARDRMADYLIAHYHSCENLVSASNSHFSFMLRNGMACPSD